VREAKRDLCLAGERIRAEEVRAVFFHMRAADGAAGRLFHRLGRRIVRHCAEDFRNYVVAPAEEHTRADLDAFSLDVVVIVQRCALNGRAREFNGGQMRQRRELAGAPDFPGDILDDGGRLFGGEFISHCPAGELFRFAECFPQGKVRYFDDHAVDQKIQLAARLLREIDFALELFRAVAIANVRADRETVLREKREHIPLVA